MSEVPATSSMGMQIEGQAAGAPPQDTGKLQMPPKKGQTETQSLDINQLMEHEIEAKFDNQVEKVKLKKLISDYQKFKASDKRLLEATNLKRDYESQVEKFKNIVNTMKQNPQATRHFLKQVYGSEDAIRQFAEDYLWEQIQREKMSPEQRELEEYREKVKRYEEQENKKKMTEAQKAEEQRVQSYVNHYDKMFTDVLTKYELPKTPETIERMSRIMQGALKQGYELSAEELGELVEQSYEKEISTIFGKANPEKLAKMLGKNAEKVREYQLSQIKKPNQNNQARTSFQSGSSKPDNKKSLTMQEAKKLWMKRAGLE